MGTTAQGSRARTHGVRSPRGSILSVADLRLRGTHLDWVIDHAARHDLVVVAGDLLDAALGDPSAQVDVAVEFLAEVRRSTEVAICSGNHDLDRRVGGERAAGWHSRLDRLGVARDGDTVLVEHAGVTHAVSVCPWWEGPASRARVAGQLSIDANRRPAGRWFWLHHAPAAGSATAWDGRRDLGDEFLGGLIDHYRPDVVIGGHVHAAPFVAGGSWWDRQSGAVLCNAGDASGSSSPAHLVIDLADDRIEWHSPGVRTETCFVDPRRACRTAA